MFFQMTIEEDGDEFGLVIFMPGVQLYMILVKEMSYHCNSSEQNSILTNSSTDRGCIRY